MADPRLVAVELDETSLGAASPESDHERRIAIFDLLEGNQFAVEGEEDGGPYHLRLSLAQRRLVFEVADANGGEPRAIILSLTPFRKVMKDYFIVCDSYYAAIRNATPSQIEAIDMGRRGLHDEGSRLLQDRLKGKLRVDHDTGRRLFTLLCALQQRG
ncbi:MAG: UPF0262 family protein [Hyphomonadaceae bacterium]